MNAETTPNTQKTELVYRSSCLNTLHTLVYLTWPTWTQLAKFARHTNHGKHMQTHTHTSNRDDQNQPHREQYGRCFFLRSSSERVVCWRGARQFVYLHTKEHKTIPTTVHWLRVHTLAHKQSARSMTIATMIMMTMMLLLTMLRCNRVLRETKKMIIYIARCNCCCCILLCWLMMMMIAMTVLGCGARAEQRTHSKKNRKGAEGG